MSKLIAAASTERWKAGLALASLGGLRLGEVRGLQWGDIDLAGNTISVRRSLLPDGSAKTTKTEAGQRTVPLFPELRRLLVAWKVKSPFTEGVRSRAGQQRNAQRAGEGEGAGLAPGGQALVAQPPPLGRLDLAHGVRDSGHDRERDDGPRKPVLHARLLRARRADDGGGRAGAGGSGRRGCLRWWASLELRLSARPLRRSRAGLVLPRAAPRFHRDRRHPSSPRCSRDRSCDDDDKEPYPCHDRGTKTCAHGRFREGGRDGDRPPRGQKSVDSRACPFSRLRVGVSDPQEDHQGPRERFKTWTRFSKPGVTVFPSPIQETARPLARQRERHDPGDLAVRPPRLPRHHEAAATSPARRDPD